MPTVNPKRDLSNDNSDGNLDPVKGNDPTVEAAPGFQPVQPPWHKH